MTFAEKVARVQELLNTHGIDGWLIYDFRLNNPFAVDFLEIPRSFHATRRFFYWIPKVGKPVKIVNKLEAIVLAKWPGEEKNYFSWKSLETALAETAGKAKTVAMEYSPKASIPTLSVVDAGTVDWIRELGPKVVSSAPLLQVFSSELDTAQIASHLDAAAYLEVVAETTWKYIAANIGKITEYDVQQFVLAEYKKGGYVTEGEPICAVNANSSNPHYGPVKGESALIKMGDWIMLDMWCKQDQPGAVFGDITRMGFAGKQADSEHLKVFNLVRDAQAAGFKFVEERVRAGKVVKGYEVDEVCRKMITEAGYGEYFVHRTGHNLYTTNHGPGANVDSIETLDDRPLIPNTTFTIEPGIYIPGKFGVRLEHDVLIEKRKNGQLEVKLTGGHQLTPKYLF